MSKFHWYGGRVCFDNKPLTDWVFWIANQDSAESRAVIDAVRNAYQLGKSDLLKAFGYCYDKDDPFTQFLIKPKKHTYMYGKDIAEGLT